MYHCTPTQRHYRLLHTQGGTIEKDDYLLATLSAGGDCPSPEQADREKQANYYASCLLDH